MDLIGPHPDGKAWSPPASASAGRWKSNAVWPRSSPTGFTTRLPNSSRGKLAGLFRSAVL